MSGLIQKDICLLLQRKQSLLLFLLCGVIMGISTEGYFVVGYLTLLTTILCVGTISYDEFDNGYPFLLTLPVTRATYAASKYLFCVLAGLISWLVSMVLCIVLLLTRGTFTGFYDMLPGIIFIPLYWIITSVMLPVQIKFGAEKSRIVIACLGATIFAVAFIASEFSVETVGIARWLDSLNESIFFLLVFVIGVAILFLSYLITKRIMEKKEF